jgi:hypothetical protein
MRSQKKPKSIQQDQEWARAEYDSKTTGLIFTKDFQSRQEALMRDPLATVGERVMAWILRRSWGEYRLYAIRDDGEPAYQADCARTLQIDKKRVSDAVSYYRKRGYLEKDGKKLYPVISPVLANPPTDDEKKSGEYRTFLEEWKVTYSPDFEEEKVLRSRLKEIVKVRLSLYKKSKQQKQKDEASLLETKKSISETGPRAVVSPFEADNQRHQKAPANPPVDEVGVIPAPAAADLVFSEIARMQRVHPNTPFSNPPIDKNNPGDAALVRRILHELGPRQDGRFDEQHLVGYFVHISAQFKGFTLGGARKAARDPSSPTGPKSVALLVNWAQDYARIAGRGGAP